MWSDLLQIMGYILASCAPAQMSSQLSLFYCTFARVKFSETNKNALKYYNTKNFNHYYNAHINILESETRNLIMLVDTIKKKEFYATTFLYILVLKIK